MARVDPQEVPFVPWPEFLRRFDWEQGEHVAAIGGTGTGKTTLVRAILPRRKYSVVLATKNKDKVLTAFQKQGFIIQKKWEPAPLAFPRVILKPGLKNAREKYKMRDEFRRCLDNVFIAGGWTVFADEVRYLTQNLKLQEELETLWLQARSSDGTIVGATQRPFWVPLEFYNASSHIFLWNENDKRNLSRISELDGANADLIRWQVARLQGHEVLYVCTKRGNRDMRMARTLVTKGR